MATSPTTLYEYYSSQGQNLPSLTERASLYEKAGLGSAGAYTGSASQNTSLLSYLSSSGGSTSTQPTSSTSFYPTPTGTLSPELQALQSYQFSPTPAPTPTYNFFPTQPTPTSPYTSYNPLVPASSPSNPTPPPPTSSLPPGNFTPDYSRFFGSSTPAPTGVNQYSFNYNPFTGQMMQPTTSTPTTGPVSSPTSTEGRTFGKIGFDIYETTGGQLTHVTESQLGQIGLNSTPDWYTKIPSIDTSQLSQTQVDLANRISTEQRGSPAITRAGTVPPGPISGAELTGGQGGAITDTTTQQQFDQYVNNTVGPALAGQTSQNAYTQPQATNGNNAYYKEWNSETKTWDIKRVSDNANVTMGNADPTLDWNKLGLNVDHINTALGISTYGGTQVGQQPIPDGLYTGKNTELQKLADKILADLNTLKAQNPFAGQTISDIRATLRSELGMDSLYTQRMEIQNKINEVLNAFDKVSGEIKDNPNLSTALRAKRLNYLSNNSQTLLNTLTRNLDTINDSIESSEKMVTERLGDMVSQYSIYKDQVQDLQSAYDKLQGRIDKVAENGQQALNMLMNNPELLKGVTKAEYDFIVENGYFPQSLIDKVGKTVGADVKSFIQGKTTAGTTTVYGLDNKGNVVSQFTFPDVTTSGSGGTVTPELRAAITTDIGIVSAYKQAIESDQSLTPQERLNQVTRLIGELRAQYLGNDDAISLINSTFGGSGTVPTQISGSQMEESRTEFNTDLSAELATVSGQSSWFGGQTDAAQRAKDRLLAKYPTFSGTINAAFKQYGV